MTRLLSVVGLAWLYCTIGELQPIEYLKCVFLEILNVTTRSVFQNKVTYISGIYACCVRACVCACVNPHATYIIHVTTNLVTRAHSH